MTLHRPLNAFTPTNSANADSSVNLGVEFTVSTTCTLTEIRWYQPSAGAVDTSVRQGGLFTTADGTTSSLVATATSAAPTGSGWQALTIPGGYTLSSGVIYRAAVLHPLGGYAADAHFFDSGAGASGIIAGPVTVVSSAASVNAAQESFFYSASLGMPTGAFNSACYWTDITVDDGAGGGALVQALDDDAGLLDPTALTRALTLAEAAGLADSTALALATVRSDVAGLADTTALARELVITDLAGALDSTTLARSLVLQDASGLADLILVPAGAHPGTIRPASRSVAHLAPAAAGTPALTAVALTGGALSIGEVGT